MIKVDVKMPSKAHHQEGEGCGSAARWCHGAVRFSRKADGSIRTVEFQGSEAAIKAATDVIRDALVRRYDKTAWMALGGFLLVAIKAYRKDRRRLLGL